jgi:hypothetical protein
MEQPQQMEGLGKRALPTSWVAFVLAILTTTTKCVNVIIASNCEE